MASETAIYQKVILSDQAPTDESLSGHREIQVVFRSPSKVTERKLIDVANSLTRPARVNQGWTTSTSSSSLWTQRSCRRLENRRIPRASWSRGSSSSHPANRLPSSFYLTPYLQPRPFWSAAGLSGGRELAQLSRTLSFSLS